MAGFNSYEKFYGGKLFSRATRIGREDEILSGVLERTDADGPHYGELKFVDHMPPEIISLINKNFGGAYRADAEGYACVMDEDVTVYGDPRCRLYAAYDLTRLNDGGMIPRGIFYNRPNAPFRHLKVYLPPEENIPEFFKVIDLCAAYRVNKLIVEVGGAMEYKKHPEINAKWVEYCVEMHEYSGKTIVIQEETFPWGKNSIHCENGGGKFLSQEKVRELIAYAEARGIEVIPEMPTLSHCDYLLLPRPEFAERAEDPYPDAYCPNAPGVYDYVFEVLQEVVDVFKPKMMHIGHDEYYTICVCPRCAGLSAPEVYAGDIKKIHSFLAERGIKTIIWSEKLLNSISRRGDHYGGSEKVYMFRGEPAHGIPATHAAIDMIPRDIICMHWYWGIRKDWDREFLGRGFPMFYGNFHAVSMPDAALRLKAGSVGGGPSNWNYATFPYLQQNGVLLDLAYASMLFWKADADDDRYTEYLEFCFRDLYKLRTRAISGPYIEALHATSHAAPHETHADGVFIDYDKNTLGAYLVTYADGSETRLPIVYGQNIANTGRDWTRAPNELIREDFERGVIDCDSYTVDSELCGMAHGTLPVLIGTKTYYLWRAENPRPEKEIVSVSLEEKPEYEGKIEVLKVSY